VGAGVSGTGHVSGGYVLLARAIEQSALWRDPPEVLRLFLYLLLHARYKAEPKQFDGFEEKRGELVTSLADIAKDCEYYERGLQEWSRQKVGRMLERLQRQGRIELLADTFGTHVRIVNYELYQNPKAYEADKCGTVVERSRDGCGTDVDTPKEREESKESQQGKEVRRNGKSKGFNRDFTGQQSSVGSTIEM
jgi:hypothetical protein